MIHKLRNADVQLEPGNIGGGIFIVTGQNDCIRRKLCGGMKGDQAKRLNELEAGNRG
ncbi:MAG: hypothetical protein IPM63_09765 [Acidobacteriota bacterium]|nr:MAG: hypothetical protein IPM63_09765 [Acidobacteriota bacterium]